MARGVELRLLIAAAAASPLAALDNGIVLPPMGFSTWNHFGSANCTRNSCGVVNLTEIGDAMVANGLRAAGYEYVNLDDGWVIGRFPNGSIIPDPKVFPHGVKATADYLHSIEMKLGLYTSRGQTTCLRRVGSQDYEKVDMQQYADWGVDYVKVDSCGGDSAMSADGVWEQYAMYRDALNASGRQVYFQMCNTLHYDDPFPEMRGGGGFSATMRPWAAQGRDVRELANGIFIQYTNNSPSFSVMLSMIDSAQVLTYDNVTAPGSFSDMDMLEICNIERPWSESSSYPMTWDEMKAQFSIWSVLTSPLIMGNDPRNLSTQCLDILTNREIIAVSQDPLVVRGKLVYQGTPGAGQPTAKPVPMGGGLLWWPNASWVPVVPPIGAGTLSTYERIPKTYNVSDCIGCGDPPESLCWNDTRPSVARGAFAEGAHCNKPGVGVNVSSPHHAFTLQVWARPLHNGDVAIVAFNRGAAPVQASVTAEMAGLKSLSALTVRDLWLKKELPTPRGGAALEVEVAPHGVRALRLVTARSSLSSNKRLAAFRPILKPDGRDDAPTRTVMAWVSTSVANWKQCTTFLGPGGEAEGTVNAISIDNLYSFNPARGLHDMFTADDAAIAEHKTLWKDGGFRTYPMIGFGANITALRPLLFNTSWQEKFISFLTSEAATHKYDGINIDFEPKTDVVHPKNNPTARDALALADLLSALGSRLHANNKTLSLDAMAVTGACWTNGTGRHYPKIDSEPCPWIRRLWDLSALSEVDELDRIISMDTYTANSTEWPMDLIQYQYFFPIQRCGVGLCPLGCNHPQPTETCVASRIGAAVVYGAAQIDLWSLWDSTARNWTTVREAWQPWIAPLRRFLKGEDAQNAQSAAAGLCWNERDGSGSLSNL